MRNGAANIIFSTVFFKEALLGFSLLMGNVTAKSNIFAKNAPTMGPALSRKFVDYPSSSNILGAAVSSSSMKNSKILGRKSPLEKFINPKAVFNLFDSITVIYAIQAYIQHISTSPQTRVIFKVIPNDPPPDPPDDELEAIPEATQAAAAASTVVVAALLTASVVVCGIAGSTSVFYLGFSSILNCKLVKASPFKL